MSTALAELRAKEAEPRDLVDRLRWRIELLIDTFGLYVAPVLLDRLENLDPDGDGERSDPTWIIRLARAIDALERANEDAFSPEAIGARQEAVERAVALAEARGERVGRVAGAADERATRMEADGDEGEIRAAMRCVRRGGRAAEPWERALW